VRELLQAKLDGQAAVARIMGRAETAVAIDELSGRLKTARTEPEMLATEGMAAQAYWSAWASLPVTFARQHRVPSRWKTFGPRRSSLTDKPQRAVSPANAVLNYLYGVLASQVTIALIGQGLEPGISIGLHADKQARASFTYDLLESVRPTIDLFLFFWPGTDGSNPAPSSGESAANFVRNCEHSLMMDLAPAPAPRWWVPGDWNGFFERFPRDRYFESGSLQRRVLRTRFATQRSTADAIGSIPNHGCPCSDRESESPLLFRIGSQLGALTNLGWCTLYAGLIGEVAPLVQQALRLSPRDPSIGYFYSLIGTVHLLQSHVDEAIVWFERVRSGIPAHRFVRSRLASAYALRGRRYRMRRSPEAGGQRCFREHCPPEGPAWRMVGGTEDPRAIRSRLFRRAPQGWDAGGVTATRLVSNARRSLSGNLEISAKQAPPAVARGSTRLALRLARRVVGSKLFPALLDRLGVD
jgi:hypothetical protein